MAESSGRRTPRLAAARSLGLALVYMFEEASRVLWGFGAIWLRTLGFTACLPLGAGLTGAALKTNLAIFLALPELARVAPGNPSLLALPAEFILGLLIGLPAALILEGAALWGELFNSYRGQDFASFYDPTAGVVTGEIAALWRLLLFCFILSSGYFAESCGILSATFEKLPVGTLTWESLQAAPELISRLLEASFVGSLILFVPLGIFFLTVELGCGVLIKILPGMTLSGEAFTLKTIFGLTAFTLGLADGLLSTWLELLTTMLAEARRFISQ